MKTNKGHGTGKDTVSISTSIPKSMLGLMDALAAQSGLSRGGYAREAIVSSISSKMIWPRQGMKANEFYDIKSENLKVAEEPPTYQTPKKAKK